jgi:hypothetical protein
VTLTTQPSVAFSQVTSWVPRWPKVRASRSRVTFAGRFPGSGCIAARKTRLDAKDTDLVVNLDPVPGQAVLDPPALGAALGVGDDLRLEAGMQFAAQELHHVGGGHGQAGVADEIGKHRGERGAIGEHDVGGDPGLIDDPVVCAEAGVADGG